MITSRSFVQKMEGQTGLAPFLAARRGLAHSLRPGESTMRTRSQNPRPFGFAQGRLCPSKERRDKHPAAAQGNSRFLTGLSAR